MDMSAKKKKKRRKEKDVADADESEMEDLTKVTLLIESKSGLLMCAI